MHRSIDLLLALAATVVPGGAIAAPIANAPNFSAQILSDHIRTLASDSFEGRGPATAGETKTTDYIIAQMRTSGLQPGGPIVHGQRQWLQDVPLLRSEILGTPRVSIMMPNANLDLTQGQEIAIRAPLNGQSEIDVASAPLVFVGYGVEAPEKHWNDFKGVDLHGKIMVVLVNDPDYEPGAAGQPNGDFGGKAMSYYGRWTYKYEEGARRGAVGVIVIHETAPASYGWLTVKNSNTIPQFDIVRKTPQDAHPPLEAWMQHDLAIRLFKASGLDFEDMKKKAQARSFQPVLLQARFAAHYKAAVTRIWSHNVLGRLDGSTHADETILYSAHWDHLGIGAPDAKGDHIYNGAVDNADGVAALLELGAAFASKSPTQRSLVFLAVTAEEKNLLGSEYYAANPVYPLAKTVADINMDALSVAGVARDFTISGTAHLDLIQDLIKIGSLHGRSYTPDPRVEAGGFYRSDHFSFAKRGVPAISFGSGRNLIDGGTARGTRLADAYTRDKYHQPSDEWTPEMNLSGIVDDLGLLYDLGRSLADSREWPNWSLDSEFRRDRDASADQRH